MGRRVRYVLAGAALATVAALGTLSEPAAASFPGINGKLVFSKASPAYADLFATDPAGSVVRLTTTANQFEFDASWSPDGSKIAYERDFTIWTMNADGSGATSVSGVSVGADPAWSPDGSKIVFERNAGTTRSLFAVSAAGGVPERLTNPGGQGSDFGAEWSPDGSKIAFARSTGPGPGDVVSLNTVATAPSHAISKIFDDPARRPGHVSWAPDGSKLAFTSDKPEDVRNDIYTVDASGANLNQVTDGPSFDFHPTWSPDGTRIAYEHVEAGKRRLDLIAPDGTGQVQIPNSQDAFDPSWQPLPSTVSVSAGNATYTALPGIENHVSITQAGTGKVRINDSGQFVNAGNKCSQIDPHTVQCQGFAKLIVNLGDRNDTATNSASTYPIIVGGPGKDTLEGSASFDILIGCAGDDTLRGGAGPDTLLDFDPAYCADSDSNDLLDGGPGPDRMQGGGGALDVVDYSSRTTGVTVDTDGAGINGPYDDGGAEDQATSGRDSVGSDIEVVLGGAGNDTLIDYAGTGILNGLGGSDHLYGGFHDDFLLGGAGVDYLYGEGGGDILAGEAGNDELYGGTGNDTYNGGSGSDSMSEGIFISGTDRDEFQIYDGEADTIASCGLGVDDEVAADGIDTVPADCEFVEVTSP